MLEARERPLIRVRKINKPIQNRWQCHLTLHRKADSRP
jgi:hypothetical protein